MLKKLLEGFLKHHKKGKAMDIEPPTHQDDIVDALTKAEIEKRKGKSYFCGFDPAKEAESTSKIMKISSREGDIKGVDADFVVIDELDPKGNNKNGGENEAKDN